MKSLHAVAFILAMIGGLNWGLIGISGFLNMGNWNLVNLALGSWPMVEWLVYVLVGLSAVYLIIGHKKTCKECSSM